MRLTGLKVELVLHTRIRGTVCIKLSYVIVVYVFFFFLHFLHYIILYLREKTVSSRLSLIYVAEGNLQCRYTLPTHTYTYMIYNHSKVGFWLRGARTELYIIIIWSINENLRKIKPQYNGIRIYDKKKYTSIHTMVKIDKVYTCMKKD